MQNAKTIIGLILLVLLITISTAQAKTVTLAWDANTEPDVTGSKL